MINQDLLNTLSNARAISKILENTPQQVKPIVSQLNVDSGFLTRYFVRQSNDISFIVEVDDKQYYRFKNNPRFITTAIEWKIVGKLETITYQTGANLYGVEDINRITVANADLTFGGLRNYITNYREFWIRE